jgi:Dyp-type peroxidase family
VQIDVQNKSKSLLGVSDLTLTAPIKRGLIPALDARSYESRLRLLLRTLNTLRVSSREAEPTPLIADTVDRIRAIHSFRLAIVGDDPFKQLLLAVAFDGGWEPYMRRIWRDLGPLLDVIFCNCEGYLTSHDHGFAEYMGWVRRAQVSTEFFYNASSLTVSDLHYLRAIERRRLCPEDKQPANGDPVEQALSALTALYRLTDMYPPKMAGLPSLLELDDGSILLRAAHHLLSDLPEVTALAKHAAERPNELRGKGRTPVEVAALRWFATREAEQPPESQTKAFDASKAQGGIINAYENLVYGCLLLVELENAAAAKALIEKSMLAADGATGSADSPFSNVSFTFQGLKIAEVPSGTLEQLPFEFREGMAARAGILGDLRYNHPSRWTLPERNWPAPPHDKPKRVELTSVHAIVQFACQHRRSMEWKELVGNDDHPLASAVHAFEASLAGKGVRILSVQAMQRFVKDSEPHSRDHFGFVDGLSQPSVDAPIEKDKFCDRVLAGDLLLGYENSLGDKALTGRLWDDSTFLVVRKLKQDVGALDEALNSLNAELAKAKLMGRWPDGRNLIDNSEGNEFLYKDDQYGQDCPLQSHIRRANPRETRPDMKTLPRIMRRGMSYGPRYEKDKPDGNAERGIVFMAYCASIAEQFEVIQSWLSGGNSSGPHSYSGLRDPFLGVPQDGDPNTFVFHDGKAELRVDLSSNRPFVQLQWGVYLFVPSKRALEELRQIAGEAENRDSSKKEDQRKIERSVLAQKGAAVIAKLRHLDQTMGPEAARTQWKIVLEDVSARMSGMSQAVWAAIREFHQGALRTPYGVLTCSNELVKQVFEDRSSCYTITGYAKRMDKSFGNIYLGMDAGRTYDEQSEAPNRAIQEVTEQEAFDSARRHTIATVERLVTDRADVTVDVKDIVDGVLAAVSGEWFGLPDEKFVDSGGWHWRSAGPPTCPGHFHSPSRYMFQPNPGTETTQAGQHHGKLLRNAVDEFVAAHRAAGTKPAARLGNALFTAFDGNSDEQKGLLARTLIGVMMGFLPTVDGNLRGLLYEWVFDRSLWDHEIAFFADGDKASLDKAKKILLQPLRRTLQLRPVPELVWRVATKAHRLGSVDVVEGDLVVVSIVSAMHESLIDDDKNLYPIFGGNRDDDPHPTHACPGYKMALGVMLGTLTGLLESARFRPAMSPLALRISRRESLARDMVRAQGPA